jgi:predicted RNA-binding Zn-ribbon protein involved in translation (DUF1610 family)
MTNHSADGSQIEIDTNEEEQAHHLGGEGAVTYRPSQEYTDAVNKKIADGHYESKTTCPRCEKNTMRPEQAMNALSRRDNETYICSACGVAEAMEDFFIGRTNNA